MHRWGDEGVDWEGINNAAEFIAKTLEDQGLTVTECKEKYGTVRVSCYFNVDSDFDVYRKAYEQAIERWPHLRAEILSDADYPDHLPPIDPQNHE